MPKSKGRRHKQKAKVSRIDQHKRTGKQLEPAWVQAMGNKLTYQSWRNDQLPEMLWASLMLASMERSEAFGEFIRIIQFVQDHERKAELKNLTITGIAEIEGQLKKEVIAFITSHPRTAQALATLKIFEELPSKEDWEENLRGFEPRKATACNRGRRHLELCLRNVHRLLLGDSQDKTGRGGDQHQQGTHGVNQRSGNVSCNGTRNT